MIKIYKQLNVILFNKIQVITWKSNRHNSIGNRLTTEVGLCWEDILSASQHCYREEILDVNRNYVNKLGRWITTWTGTMFSPTKFELRNRNIVCWGRSQSSRPAREEDEVVSSLATLLKWQRKWNCVIPGQSNRTNKKANK